MRRPGPGSGAPPCPGATPTGRRTLLAPVAALRQALIYRMFLDDIEPDERVYHAHDPAHWLRPGGGARSTRSAQR